MNLTTEIQSTPTTRTLKELFWRRGYENTSIADVVQATGMNRYALYNSFGGKRELFLAALDDYHEERKQVFLADLDNASKRPIDAIRNVMEFAIREMADRGAGCFICNVANEFSQKDPVIAERVQVYLREIEFAFGNALSRAKAAGELNKNLTPESGAKMMIAILLGVGARAQTRAPGRELLQMLRAGLQALGRTKECAQS